MKKKDASTKITSLSKALEEHNYRYYVLDQPSISDKEYDDLLKELMSLEEHYPELKQTNSPTQRIGAKVPSGSKTVKHEVKMYSLDNTYSIEEIKKWHERVLKGLDGEKPEYFVELKLDGISASLRYENGEMVYGVTRGDGLVGEDVTHNVKTIRSIPLQLKNSKQSIPARLDVRAEIFMDHKAFKALNAKRREQNEELFANARNATSGSIKLLDSRITAERNLKCFIHSFGMLEGGEVIASQAEFLKQVKAWGFLTNKHNRLCQSIDEVIAYCMEFQEKRDALPYETDGVVIKVNDLTQQQILGHTQKAPRWAVSYKFPAQQATTEIDHIIVQVGRTGVLTPVAELKPVECAGVTISRATLHNFDEISRLKVNAGDRVLIERAGDVIPKIVKVVEKKSKGILKVPKKCPECGGKVVKEETDAVSFRCVSSTCPKKIERALVHFASRGAMDIDGLGESIVVQLMQEGLVENIVDIYKLKEEQLLNLDLFAEKKAQNLIKSIEQSKGRPLSRILFALGVANIGAKAADTLAKRFKTIDRLLKAEVNDFTAVDDIGVIMAESLVSFFKDTAVRKTIKELKAAGFSFKEPEEQLISDKLKSKKFVFTGELEDMSRQEAGALVKKFGADIVSSVSKKTDYVVTGKNPGSKYEKAIQLGINILNENQFQELIND